MPMRSSMRLSAATPMFRSGIACCTATAQRTASTTLANSTSRPSPVVLTMRPRCPAIFGSKSSRRSALSCSSVTSSSAPISREYPATSAARIAASLRSTRSPLKDFLPRARHARVRRRAPLGSRCPRTHGCSSIMAPSSGGNGTAASDSGSAVDPVSNPLIEAHARRLSAHRRPAVHLRAHAQRYLAAVGLIRRLAPFRAEGLFNFRKSRPLESDHVAQTGDPARENTIIGFDRPEVALIFEHSLYSVCGFTRAAARKSRTARTMLRRVSGPGCSRWKTARTPPSATCTLPPAPSLISAPTASAEAIERCLSLLYLAMLKPLVNWAADQRYRLSRYRWPTPPLEPSAGIAARRRVEDIGQLSRRG